MKLGLNCNVEYHPSFLSKAEANELFKHLDGFKELTNMLVLKTLAGESYSYEFGKLTFTDKKLQEVKTFPESVWGPSMIWSDQMILIKNRIENFTGHKFEVCVCIYYPDGNSGVAYHSDYVAFGDTSFIPSLSLGEEREFYLREKETLTETKIILENGSLIIMAENYQERYEHSLPINDIYKRPRINLTFRKYGFKKTIS